MKKIGFIGAYDKTDLIIYIAKILTVLNQKVLVIDATINQKARYVVPVINPTTEYVTEYEDIDIAVGFQNVEGIKRYIGLSEEQELEYDIILIDTDNYIGFEGFKLNEAIKNGFIPVVKIGKLNYFDVKDIEKYLASNKIVVNEKEKVNKKYV